MKYLKISLVVVGLMMTSWAISATPAAHASALQGQSTSLSTALERGYRTGYSDGYNAGYGDVANRAARNYQSKEEYQRGDRNYSEAWGTAETYRDGYQQGFERGYGAGYDRRLFDSSIPAGLAPRGTVDSGPASVASSSPDNNITSSNNTTSPNNTVQSSVGGPLYIPRDTVLTIELDSPLSTDVSQRGDPFQARVIGPQEYQGAIVEGRVTNVKRSGRVKGAAELQLSFESLRMDNRTVSFRADVIEVVDMGNRDGAATVDSEGGVRGRSSTKDDISKVGASTGIGAIIGAVVGGGKGAAIGAAIGGTVGTGSVLSKRGKDVRLDRGQQLKIRAATETRIQ
ncbi:MAG: hypothetical protein M3R69_14425 [Acidobacteriota bacterium]|nr:hypothetical protein [Acidobacteriota bacterium]